MKYDLWLFRVSCFYKMSNPLYCTCLTLCEKLSISSGNKRRQTWIPGVQFRQTFHLSVLFLLFLFFFVHVVLCSLCVLYVFSHFQQYYPLPPMIWVCLFSYRELLYLCVLFFIFLYGYLLHYVVYNTVVCINTIIYFSMENRFKSKANDYTPGKIRVRHTEVSFSNKWNGFSSGISEVHPLSLKIGPCDLSASILSSS